MSEVVSNEEMVLKFEKTSKASNFADNKNI